ncbi:levansucrase, partial [Pseudomonas syringae pv. aceris str. M302273]
WNFRDPSPFIDPNDGKLYMVFEGNVAGERGTHTVGAAELGPVPTGHEEVGGGRVFKWAVSVWRLLKISAVKN